MLQWNLALQDVAIFEVRQNLVTVSPAEVVGVGWRKWTNLEMSTIRFKSLPFQLTYMLGSGKRGELIAVQAVSSKLNGGGSLKAEFWSTLQLLRLTGDSREDEDVTRGFGWRFSSLFCCAPVSGNLEGGRTLEREAKSIMKAWKYHFNLKSCLIIRNNWDLSN